MKVLQAIMFANSRTPRPAYWAYLVVLLIFSIFGQVLIANAMERPLVPGLAWLAITGYLWLVLCVTRCHDMGRAPWWALLTLVPLFGWGVAIWLGVEASESPEAAS